MNPFNLNNQKRTLVKSVSKFVSFIFILVYRHYVDPVLYCFWSADIGWPTVEIYGWEFHKRTGQGAKVFKVYLKQEGDNYDFYV